MPSALDFSKGLRNHQSILIQKNQQELNWAPAWTSATGQALMPKQGASVHATSCRASRWPGPPFRTAVLTRAVTWCQVQSGSLPSIITGRGGNIPCVNNSVNVLFFFCAQIKDLLRIIARFTDVDDMFHIFLFQREAWSVVEVVGGRLVAPLQVEDFETEKRGACQPKGWHPMQLG